jgi:hypothetical protein
VGLGQVFEEREAFDQLGQVLELAGRSEGRRVNQIERKQIGRGTAGGGDCVFLQ